MPIISQIPFELMLWTNQNQEDIWQVADLTRYIRELFEIDFRLQDVQVQGEISNFTRARSGHLYFTLKDNDSQLRCVMWRSAVKQLRFRPQEGDAVIVGGRVSVYEATGQYQLYVEEMQAAGIGDLAHAFEKLKQKLAAEGLFDDAHKQPIPPFPEKIGIVTSPDAAALRDILNVLERRWPVAQVLISPTLVQGNAAPPQIVTALKRLDERDDINTIIVARGGGSIEDLWAFNDENVVRAVFNSHHPIISGVGHETDFTLIDFAADLRAPTPSAAAELVVPDGGEFQAALIEMGRMLDAGIMHTINKYRQQVEANERTLSLLSPQHSLDFSRQRVDTLTMQLEQVIKHLLAGWRNQSSLASAKLQTVSPLATLNRGYAIVRDNAGRIVKKVDDVDAGNYLQIQVADGEIEAIVKEPTK